MIFGEIKYLKETILQVKFSQLSARQIFSCVIQALLIPLALFGLVYFRITAGVDLSTLTGLVSAIVTGVAAFIAQIAFTVLSINKLKEALVRPFDSAPIQTENPATTAHKSTFSRIKSSLSSICATICLVSNAIGNGVLVYAGSVLSILGAIACALNSLAGNLPEDEDRNHKERATADDVILQKLIRLRTEDLGSSESDVKSELTSEFDIREEHKKPGNSSSNQTFFNCQSQISATRQGEHEVRILKGPAIGVP
jgi:hypothetical protein